MRMAPPVIVYESKWEAGNNLNVQQQRKDSTCPDKEILRGHYLEKIRLMKEKFKVEYKNSIYAMIQTLFSVVFSLLRHR